MVLQQIQSYIRTQKRVSLSQLEIHFQIEAKALRGLLDQLVRRGRIKKLATAHTCHGCQECAPTTLECYEWSWDT